MLNQLSMRKCRMLNQLSRACAKWRRIKCCCCFERRWMNSSQPDATERCTVNPLQHSLYPTRISPLVCRALAFRHPMAMAISFNNEALPLRNNHIVGLRLLIAADVMRQTAPMSQIRLVLLVPQSIPSITSSVRFRSNPFKLTPALPMLSAVCRQTPPTPPRL